MRGHDDVKATGQPNDIFDLYLVKIRTIVTPPFKLHMHPVNTYSYVDLIISYPILIFSSAVHFQTLA